MMFHKVQDLSKIQYLLSSGIMIYYGYAVNCPSLCQVCRHSNLVLPMRLVYLYTVNLLVMVVVRTKSIPVPCEEF